MGECIDIVTLWMRTGLILYKNCAFTAKIRGSVCGILMRDGEGCCADTSISLASIGNGGRQKYQSRLAGIRLRGYIIEHHSQKQGEGCRRFRYEDYMYDEDGGTSTTRKI